MKELQRVQTEMINKMIQQNKLMYDQLQEKMKSSQ